MITRVRIQNYRSFVDAEVKLRPFSLVVGANGSGKTNLLRFIEMLVREFGYVSSPTATFGSPADLWRQKHVNFKTEGGGFLMEFSNGVTATTKMSGEHRLILDKPLPFHKDSTCIFNIDPAAVSSIEVIQSHPALESNGSGTAQVLESLKSGDREDLFDKIEENFKRYVPEVEKLSLRTVEQGKKQIQVREKGLKELLPATELSEGTRIILCILTILHQERPPPIILLEDTDRGLHPRLFEYLVPIMRDIAERHDINILATTHNPYLVDCFLDDKEAVILVEKKDGASTLSTLAERMEGLDYDAVNPEDMPLGNLWFSGLVGGVPPRINLRPAK